MAELSDTNTRSHNWTTSLAFLSSPSTAARCCFFFPLLSLLPLLLTFLYSHRQKNRSKKESNKNAREAQCTNIAFPAAKCSSRRVSRETSAGAFRIYKADGFGGASEKFFAQVFDLTTASKEENSFLRREYIHKSVYTCEEKLKTFPKTAKSQYITLKIYCYLF